MSFIIVLSVLSGLFFIPVEGLFAALPVLLFCEIALHRDRFRVQLFPGAAVYVYFLAAGTAVGLCHVLAHSYEPRNVLKDVVYVLFPLLFWLTGKNIALQKERCFTNLFLAGVVVSVCDFADSLFQILRSGTSGMSLFQFRHLVGVGHPLTLFTVFLYIFMPQNIALKKKHAYGYIGLLILDMLVHFSRITLLNTAVFLIFLKIWKKPVKALQYGMLIAAGLAAVYGLFPSVFDNYIERLSRSLTEISHVRDSWDHASIVTNWRGYEVHRELEKFQHAGLPEQVLGGGFGTQLDVEGNAYLVTTEETLPFLHNGYFSILMVWGITGCAACVMLFLLLYLNHRTLAEDARDLWKAFVFVIILDTLVVHGLFFSTGTASIFLYLGVLDSCKGEKDGSGTGKTAQRFN